MDIYDEIRLNEEISRAICKPGHRYNETTKRCYPVIAKSSDIPAIEGGSADNAVKAEIANRMSARSA